MLADIDRPDFDETSVADVRYSLLDTASIALLGENCNIMGVIGDTVIVHDMTMMGDNSRLLLFDANDGHLIRSIRHIGQGPGEYRWIMNVVTDPDRGDIIMMCSNGKAHRYTTGDRYVESYDMSKNQHGGSVLLSEAFTRPTPTTAIFISISTTIISSPSTPCFSRTMSPNGYR